MAAEHAGAGPAGPEVVPAPRYFTRWGTLLTGAIVLTLSTLAVWPAPPLETLQRPDASLARVVGRDLDFRAAARGAPAWERRLYDLVLGAEDDSRDEAIDWYTELVDEDGSPLAELQRIVLLAEDGRAADVARALAEWVPAEEPGRRLAAWATAAYGPEPPAPAALESALTGARTELEPDWFRDRLVAALAIRLGDRATAAAADAAVLARGRRLLQRQRALLGAEGLLLAGGALAAAGLLGAGRRRVADAPIPPAWRGLDGLGLFTRGGVGLIGVSGLGSFLPDSAGVAALLSLLSAGPLLAATWAYCRARRTSARAVFGLRAPPGRWGALGRASVALIGLSTLADLVIETAGARLGFSPHWTDGFQERLVWGTRGDVLADVLDSVIMAPILEEVLFRGVLYATFRLRLAPVPAALASGIVFAAAHGYGVVGFASVLGSGLVWALAYEATRSLLPGMLAHATGNLLATATVVLTLR